MKIETTLTVSLSQLKTAKEVVTFFEGFYGDTYDAVLLLNHLVDETPDTFPFQGKEVMVKYEKDDNGNDEKTALQEKCKTLEAAVDEWRQRYQKMCDHFDTCNDCPCFESCPFW